MNTYLMNFGAYSFAMVGFILTIVYIYKKAINPTVSQNNKNFLKVENTLRLSPVKTIYVIKAGDEKFLIAGDSANTTMLAKLESKVDEKSDGNDIKNISENSPLRVIQKIGRG